MKQARSGRLNGPSAPHYVHHKSGLQSPSSITRDTTGTDIGLDNHSHTLYVSARRFSFIEFNFNFVFCEQYPLRVPSVYRRSRESWAGCKYFPLKGNIKY